MLDSLTFGTIPETDSAALRHCFGGRRKDFRLRINATVLFTAIGLAVGQSYGQGTFQNLDFEAANVPILPPNEIAFLPFSDALPGWVGYAGTNQAEAVLYNGIALGAAFVNLFTPNTASSGIFAIGGNYTVALRAGSNPNGNLGDIVSAGIAQTGLIPFNAQSLRFSVGSLSAVLDLRVTLNGQDIPFFPLFAGSNYEVYGGDISAFAGLTAELRFTELRNSIPNAPPFRVAFLDDISFSPQSIPEPSVFGLFVLGSLLLGWRFWKRKS